MYSAMICRSIPTWIITSKEGKMERSRLRCYMGIVLCRMNPILWGAGPEGRIR